MREKYDYSATEYPRQAAKNAYLLVSIRKIRKQITTVTSEQKTLKRDLRLTSDLLQDFLPVLAQYLLNVVAQCLLLISGFRPLLNSPVKSCVAFSGNKHAKKVELIGIPNFRVHANSLIMERNQAIHYADVASLEKGVDHAISVVQRRQEELRNYSVEVNFAVDFLLLDRVTLSALFTPE